jgi:hypothetical protein
MWHDPHFCVAMDIKKGWGLVDGKWEYSIVWKANGVFYTSKLLDVDGVLLDNLAITFALVVLTYVGCLERYVGSSLSS